MRLDPQRPVHSFLLALAARLLRALLRALWWSCRYRIVAGREHVEELVAAPRAVILSFWHNRLGLAAPFVLDHLHGRGVTITVLASQSRDGELATRLAALWRLHTVRGSATRGGRQALRGLHRAIVRERSSPIMIPDGPTGPLYHFKVGVAVLAQLSGAPIVPFGFAAHRFWRIGSWDRLIVPRPFTRVVVTVGAPRVVAKELAGEDLEAERDRLETELDELTLRAEQHAGAADVCREHPSGTAA